MREMFFATDLHGNAERYKKLFNMILKEMPSMVFLGGDLLPHMLHHDKDIKLKNNNFTLDFIGENLQKLKDEMKEKYPAIFAIMGNDDARIFEDSFIELDENELWYYSHNRMIENSGYNIYGYAYVPPTPFLLKDWERYDVSRYVDPGCIHPTEGKRSVEVKENHIEHSTISEDLENLAKEKNLSNSIFLFHSPPYETELDRAGLDGKRIDHVPLDVHVGSIAIRRFIEQRQPMLTLHGHIHESTKLTGKWKCRINNTHCFQGAHHGKELSVVKFDPEKLDNSKRELV